MKLVVFCEGQTEAEVVPPLIRRWLQSQTLEHQVGVRPVQFKGWADLVQGLERHANMHLAKPDVIGVVSLLDLYGADLYSTGPSSVRGRVARGRHELQARVGSPRFRQFFAVHELEAWLLASPTIFPKSVESLVAAKAHSPESVDLDHPPATFLNEVYRKILKRRYHKTSDGKNLFAKLDPEVAAAKCPHLREMLAEILQLVQAAGRSTEPKDRSS